MSELESQLTQLGRELEWPPSPDLRAAITAGLRKKRNVSGPSGAPPVSAQASSGDCFRRRGSAGRSRSLS